MTADAGGSNGYRIRLWKVALQQLADAMRLDDLGKPLDPGIQQGARWRYAALFFTHGSWRGKPLVSRAVIVNLIGNTKTRTGLTINAELDENAYRQASSLGCGTRRRSHKASEFRRLELHDIAKR